MTRPTKAIINLAALKHNLAQVKSYAPQASVMAMVKSNAYAHGLPIVHQLQDADAFGVACLEEALALRHMGVDKRIVLLEGFFAVSDIDTIVNYNLEVVVHQHRQIDLLLCHRCPLPIKIWLKIDTGMHRLGFVAEDVLAAWQRLQGHPNIIQPINLMTHFACANERDDQAVAAQMLSFNELTSDWPGSRSLANSAAILMYPRSHADWIRPGIMLYGVSPFSDKTGIDLGLKPVMTLQSRILAINTYLAGSRIGYGATYTCPEDMRVGIVPIGYGDGYPRSVKPGTPVLVGDTKVKLLGRVSMDMLSIDLRDLPNAEIGDPVTLWGEKLPVETIAKHADTIAYTLFCGLTSRVSFDYQL